MALADDIKTQFDAWVSANESEKLISFKAIIDEWSRASMEKALGRVEADLTTKETDCKSEMDTLLT